MDGPEHVFDDRTPGVEEHEPTASYLSYYGGAGAGDPDDDRLFRCGADQRCSGRLASRSG